jgi:predicted Rossmann-fold nucleotide-binding protein
MGGHSMKRTSPEYAKVARIAQSLAERGFLIATGGGPGAMEAAHLGAYFGGRGDELARALDLLSTAAHYRDREWLSRAFEVRARFGDARFESLGIPTWHYGHEPPNVFATHIAKYFANSVREEGLLAIAKGGVIFSPGSAGTIQEIFQDACQNHYLTAGVASPMIFLGSDYWQKTKPVFPLLSQLAEGHEYAEHLALTDDPEEVVERISRFDQSSRITRS